MTRKMDEKPSLTELVLHELRELRRVVATVNDVFHQKLLLHCAQLILSVLLLVEGLSRLGDPIHIGVELLLLDVAVAALFNHVFWRFRFNLIYYKLQAKSRRNYIIPAPGS